MGATFRIFNMLCSIRCVTEFNSSSFPVINGTCGYKDSLFYRLCSWIFDIYWSFLGPRYAWPMHIVNVRFICTWLTHHGFLVTKHIIFHLYITSLGPWISPTILIYIFIYHVLVPFLCALLVRFSHPNSHTLVLRLRGARHTQ